MLFTEGRRKEAPTSNLLIVIWLPCNFLWAQKVLKRSLFLLLTYLPTHNKWTNLRSVQGPVSRSQSYRVSRNLRSSCEDQALGDLTQYEGAAPSSQPTRLHLSVLPSTALTSYATSSPGHPFIQQLFTKCLQEPNTNLDGGLWKRQNRASCRLRSAELDIQISQQGSLTQWGKIYRRGRWEHQILGGGELKWEDE